MLPLQPHILSHEYATFVDQRSSRVAANSLYPETILRSLASYLKQSYEYSIQVTDGLVKNNAEDDGFVILYESFNGVEYPTAFKTPDELQALKLETDPSIVGGRLLFLRGDISPTWLNCVGAKFQVDPYFFHRHMESRHTKEQSAYFTLPALPSATASQTRFRLVTIGSRMVKKTPQQAELQKLRSEGNESWISYTEKLRRGRRFEIQHGDSLVREFSIHDHEHFSFEQDISVFITNSADRPLMIIWLDVGRDLASSPKGPWSHEFFGVGPMEVDYYPTVQDTTHVVLGKTDNDNSAWPLNPEETIPVQDKITQPVRDKITQNASRLHLDFRLGDQALRIEQPTRALLQVMRLSSASIMQYLNMVKTKIDLELGDGNADENNEYRLTNLLYHKQKLDRHIRRLVENIRFISLHIERVRSSLVSVDDQQASEVTVMESIVQDFEHLHAMACDLSAECDRGIGILMNKTMVRESQKAIEQAEGVAKLTRLAFIYIPLSFTGTFFGMNFSEFTPGASLSIWVWFVVSLPILAISFAFMKVGFSEVAGFFGREQRRGRNGRGGLVS